MRGCGGERTVGASVKRGKGRQEVTVRLSGVSTYAGSPAPKRDVELADKLSGKVILSVDFKTGKVSGPLLDQYRGKELEGEDSVTVLKKDFLRVWAKQLPVKEMAKELGIAVGTLYYYKDKWKTDITALQTLEKAAAEGNADAKGILKASGITVNDRSEKALEEADSPITDQVLDKLKEFATAQEKKNAETEPIHQPTMGEVEDFFTEPENKAPELPPNNRVTVLEALDILDALRDESGTIETIWDVMRNMPFHPNIKKLLYDRQVEVDEKLAHIEAILGNITVAI
jgi:hypothetical protein